MTCDERLEELLNRAGQTISDIEPLEIGEDENLIDYATKSRGHAQAAVLHMTDIIDRLEWALDKTLREKAYIRAKCCYFCGLKGDNQTPETCEECDVGKGVPEDWSEDDD